jgi:hypothetical protein
MAASRKRPLQTGPLHRDIPIDLSPTHNPRPDRAAAMPDGRERFIDVRVGGC